MSISSAEEVSAIANIVASAAAASSLALTTSEARQLLYTIQCNAHQVTDEEGRAIGLGLFPWTSMMNHSCTPNCAHYFEIRQFEHPRLIMVALEDISAGAELCYSYVPLYQSTANRRLQLQRAYGFLCQCDRCAAQPHSDAAESLTPERGDARSSDGKTGEGGVSAAYPADAEIDQSTDCCESFIALLLQIEALQRSAPETEEQLQVFTAILDGFLSSGGLKIPIGSKLLLRACCAVAKAAQALIEHSAAGLQERVARRQWGRLAASCGVLALGCVYHFTRSVQLEAADLEHAIAVGFAELSEDEDTDERSLRSSDASFEDDVVHTVQKYLTALGLEHLFHDSEDDGGALNLTMRMACWRAKCQLVDRAACATTEAWLARCFAASALDTTIVCRGGTTDQSIVSRRASKLRHLLSSENGNE